MNLVKLFSNGFTNGAAPAAKIILELRFLISNTKPV